jgi:hypothetical protein
MPVAASKHIVIVSTKELLRSRPARRGRRWRVENCRILARRQAAAEVRLVADGRDVTCGKAALRVR